MRIPDVEKVPGGYEYPTISALRALKGSRDEEDWGLCQNSSGEVAWGTADCDWKLQISLDGIYQATIKLFGEDYDPDTVEFIYFITRNKKTDAYGVGCRIQLLVSNATPMNSLTTHLNTHPQFLM